MSSQDMHNQVKSEVALNLQEITSDTTIVGEITDNIGFEGLEYFLQSGVLAAGVLTPKVEHGDDSALADAADVPTDFLKGTIAEATFAATDDNKTKRIGYVGKKRYVRLSMVSTGSVTSSYISAVATKGFPLTVPTEVDV